MKYLSTVLLAILSISTFAQNSQFELGIQGSPGIAFMRINTHKAKVTNTPMASFSYGLFLQYNLNKTFSLRVDPSFERKGYIYNVTFTNQFGSLDGASKNHENFNYITIPILLRAAVGNKIRYFINAGPYIGFLLSQKTTYTASNDLKFVYNNTNSYKTTDLGITAGIGLSIPIKDKFALSVEARNNIGLINIRKSSNSNDKIFSANLLIGFAYKFGSKK